MSIGENKLQQPIDYRFKNIFLLKEALTHASFKGKKNNNERLEFLGDRVLGLVMAKALYDRFPESNEGELAARYSYLVSREVLAQVAENLKIDLILNRVRSDLTLSALKKNSAIANACEALIAALFIDGGLEIVEAFILKQWSDLLNMSDSLERDAKSLLQEWVQGLGKVAPIYRILERTGPDHDPLFKIGVEVEGQDMAIGEGSSKREAEQKAAKRMLNHVRGHND